MSETKTSSSSSSSSSSSYRLRIRNASQLVTITSSKKRVLTGTDQDKIEIIENGGMIIGHDGRIVAVGKDEQIEKDYKSATFDAEIDAKGKAILPGLVDGHTHPVWSGDRVHEFKLKLAGASYMEIHKVLHRAKSLQPIEIVANFCGGHSVPKDKTPKEATEDIINVQLPAIKKSMEKGEISPELIDVFCEKGVFELEDTKKILLAGQSMCGLKLNFHGDELYPLKGAEMGADLNAIAIAHLEHISEGGMKAMAKSGTVATLLPTTAFILRITPPPARAMITAGVPVALGTDYNPNAHCLSMAQTMNLACVMMKMTMNEALVAATLNAAASLCKAADYGSLEVGKYGDFLLLSTAPWEHIIYEICDPPIEAVYKRGKVIYRQEQTPSLCACTCSSSSSSSSSACSCSSPSSSSNSDAKKKRPSPS